MRYRLDDKDDSDYDSVGIMVNGADVDLESPGMLSVSETQDESLNMVIASSLQKTELYCSPRRDSLDDIIREVGLSFDDLFDDKRDDSNRDARKPAKADSSRRCNPMTDKTSAGVKNKIDSLPSHLKSLMTAFSHIQHGQSRKI